MLYAALALAVVVAQTTPATPATPAPFDAFSKVLSDTQRAQISRDSRCNDAKTTTDQFVSSKDPQTGVKAMVALEKCAVLSRVGDWSDYHNYVITAAGAVAYEIGLLANEPKAYERALKDLQAVSGYEAPSSVTSVVLTTRQTSNTASPDNNAQGAGAAQDSFTAGLPMQNSNTMQHTTMHETGYSGTWGELATEIGEAAQAALSAHGPRPQASP